MWLQFKYRLSKWPWKPSDYLAEPIINYEPKLFSLPYRKNMIGTNNVDTIEVDYKYLTKIVLLNYYMVLIWHLNNVFSLRVINMMS